MFRPRRLKILIDIYSQSCALCNNNPSSVCETKYRHPSADTVYAEEKIS